jgi:hypothetical protein
MVVSYTQLRGDLYRLLDAVLESGEALEIERKGQRLRVVPAQPRTLETLFPPDPSLVVGDVDEALDHDWSGDWSP